MSELDPATVAAANDAWVWAPELAEVAETEEYRLVRFPDDYAEALQLQWARSTRPAAEVLDDIVTRAREFDVPEMQVFVKLSALKGFEDALRDRGAELIETADVLATAFPTHVETATEPGLEVRWRTTREAVREANTTAIAIFGGSPASDEEIARKAAVDRDAYFAGTGGAVVAYLDGAAVGIAGLNLVDGVARLWGGGVREAHRGRGAYRAMTAARMKYAAEHGAAMALTQGRISTSSPILRRMGFIAYGRERIYRLELP